ncbi:MAG: helix-turn-helix domain-containing protein [Pseudomonadota bacterium]|nr:helix-turn-helix domain-containing protein [Pseudomonadota bacterium]
MTKRSVEWHKLLVDDVMNDPEGRAEYEAFTLQLELAEAMKKARLKAHLTQEAVANKMVTKKSVVARLEAAGGRGKHSPSINTLTKYAAALGCKLQISFVKKIKHLPK